MNAKTEAPVRTPVMDSLGIDATAVNIAKSVAMDSGFARDSGNTPKKSGANKSDSKVKVKEPIPQKSVSRRPKRESFFPKTGRTKQINFKVRQSTLDEFDSLANRLKLMKSEVFEHSVEILSLIKDEGISFDEAKKRLRKG